MDKLFYGNVSTTTAPDTTDYVLGYPTDGDPTTAAGATEPGAGWFWMMTAELLNLVTGASITPNGASLTQVYQAVNTIAGAAATAAQAAAIAAATTLATAARTGAVSDVLALFTGTNQDLTAASGFQYLPGNQLHQWVEEDVTGADVSSVTFAYPKSFGSNYGIPQVTVLDASLAGGSSNFLGTGVVSRSASGCVISLGENGGGARNVTVRVDVWGKR